METVVDLLKVAIENEVKAGVFYQNALEVAGDGEAQMVFLELVEMEAGHARLLVDRFGAYMQEQGVDAEAFLADLEANTERALNEKEIALLEDAEMGPVIDFAISMEAAARDNYNAFNRWVESLVDDDGNRIVRLTDPTASSIPGVAGNLEG